MSEFTSQEEKAEFLTKAKTDIKIIKENNKDKENCKMIKFNPDTGLCGLHENKDEELGKKKYRRGSMILHPDKNPGCKESAEKAFKIVKTSCQPTQVPPDQAPDQAQATPPQDQVVPTWVWDGDSQVQYGIIPRNLNQNLSDNEKQRREEMIANAKQALNQEQ